MRVLIIDDSDFKARDFERTLNKFGITDIDIEVSRNDGLLALKQSYEDEKPYDVLFLDMQLPLRASSMNIMSDAGYLILEEIDRRGWDIPVVMISSDDYSSDIDCLYHIQYNPSISLDEDVQEVIKLITG